MVRRTLAGRAGAASLATSLSSGVAALAARGANLLVKTATHLPFVPPRYAAALRFEPPLRRYASRTETLRDTLKATLFGERLLTAPRRGEVDVVVNACELRSGAAFRFGSRETSCSRYGIVDGNKIEVAEAVAASAAYPLLLPALDRSWRFRRRNGTTYKQRVVLTDGGVYDNLATTCLEPGRLRRGLPAAPFPSLFSIDVDLCRHPAAHHSSGGGLRALDGPPDWLERWSCQRVGRDCRAPSTRAGRRLWHHDAHPAEPCRRGCLAIVHRAISHRG